MDQSRELLCVTQTTALTIQRLILLRFRHVLALAPAASVSPSLPPGSRSLPQVHWRCGHIPYILLSQVASTATQEEPANSEEYEMHLFRSLCSSCFRLSHDIHTFNSPLFSHAASKCNWRKKKFCTCPPISNQRFLSPVCRYNLSQMSANPKTDVFMVETYKSMAWATASFPGEKSYRYDLCFF